MSGSETARRLTDWFRQWRVPLRKFLIAKGTVPATDVNDVTQEVFLRLLRYDRGQLVEYPQAYLFKIASNVANEWSIRARVRCPHGSRWLPGLLAEDSPEDEMAQREARAEVERALNLLTPRQRAALKLQFSEGLGRAEIAARLGITERAVKRDTMNGYQKLRTELSIELLTVLTNGRE